MPELSDASGARTLCAPPERPRCEPATVVKHISHEIRQHLSAIESIAFYLEMVLPRAENKARRQVGNLQFQVHQLNWVLADAVHYFEAEPARPQLSDLGEIVSKSLAEWNALNGPEIRLEIATELPLVWIDVEQFRHLLRNLMFLFRGIATTSSGVTLNVSAGTEEVRLSLESDAGVMSVQTFESLFNAEEEQLPTGSGLALASVRRIADSHGARIEVGSQDAGIRVVVAFPIA